MALGNVFMTDTDGNLGSPVAVENEKICGLLFDISAQKTFWTEGAGQQIAEELKDKVVEINSKEDAKKLMLTYGSEDPANDLFGGIPGYHVSQFLTQAGGSCRLFIAFADCSRDWDVLLDMQRASGGIISQFGVWTEQRLWSEMDASARTYSVNMIASLNATMESMANDYFAPASVILSANTSKVKTASGDNNKVVFSKIPDCITDARYVTVLLGQSMDTQVKQMQGALTSTTPVGTIGLMLGCLAQANVGESFAWVSKFDLRNYISGIEMGFGDSNVVEGVLTNATSYAAITATQADELDDKGYVFLRTYAGIEGGVYYTKDRTCSDGDYCTVARNRTINKSRRLTRAALLPYVNSPVKVDPAKGQLTAGQITEYTNLISDGLNAMANAGEISGVGVVNVPATQNILRNKKLTFSYTIVPLGCAESITVTEGLVVSR